MGQTAQMAEEFRGGMPFVGGWLWLDLLNTVMSDGRGTQDLIATPSGFSAWLSHAGLGVGGQHQPLDELRSLLRTAVAPLRQGEPIPPEVLNAVNGMLDGVRLRLRLEPTAEGLKLVEKLDLADVGPGGAIARDFAQFVCEHEPQRLKHCDNPACSMVFYDRGKNNTRRWCTMSICGNRDKVARYRARLAGRKASAG